MNTNAVTAGEPALCFWRTPKCYVGYDPIGHILVEAMHRESSILAQSNYWTAWHRLHKVAGIPYVPPLEATAHDGPFSRFNPDDAPAVYDWQASDSMVGWIRYLMLNPKKAPPALVKEALDIEEALKQYPVLNEDDYSERRQEAMDSYWRSEPLDQRVYWCHKAGASIFSARRDYVPTKVEYDWLDGEMFA